MSENKTNKSRIWEEFKICCKWTFNAAAIIIVTAAIVGRLYFILINNGQTRKSSAGTYFRQLRRPASRKKPGNKFLPAGTGV